MLISCKTPVSFSNPTHWGQCLLSGIKTVLSQQQTNKIGMQPEHERGGKKHQAGFMVNMPNPVLSGEYVCNNDT